MTFLNGKYRKPIVRFWRLAAFFLGSIVFYLVAVYFNFFWLFGAMPDLREVENPESQVASEIISADGQLLSKYFLENRTPIEFDQLSPNVIKALIATEDARFVKHSGIDPRSMFRVFKGLLSSDQETTGGGSTLTQQLAKNLFQIRKLDKYKGSLGDIPIVRTVIAKTKEWILSVQLESNYTKQEIMMMYLNTVSFGNNAEGIKTASKTYFKKEPWNVTITEAALLVGMLQNPSRFNPRVFPERTLERRNTVLGQMLKYGFLTREEFVKNKTKPLGLNFFIENHNTGPAPYFRETLRDWMKDWLKKYNEENGTEYDLYTDGLRIYTTIDSRMQKYAEEAAQNHMREQQRIFDSFFKSKNMNPWVIEKGKEYVEDPNFINRAVRRTARYRELKRVHNGDMDKIWAVLRKPIKMRVFSYRGDRDTIMSPLDSIKYYNKILRIAMASMDPRTGDVKAWVGGVNFKHFKFDQVYQGKRQPGSTFKPFVYCTALNTNFVTPCDPIVDRQVCIGNWCPKNSTGGYSGQPLTLRQALAKSVNSISAHLMKLVGPKAVVDHAYKIGITSPLPEKDVTICLGTPSVSVYEMVNAYCTFANGGKHVDPRFVTRIEDRNGRVLADFPVQEKEVISPSIAYQMLFIMRGAVEDPWGTAQRLRTQYGLSENNDIAAKTGTTSDYSDGWFMGMTPNLVTGVWVGAEDTHVHHTTMAYGQGARIAMPAWGQYMQALYKDPDLAGHDKAPYRRERFEKPGGMEANIGCGGPKLDSTSTYVRPKITDDESILF